MSLKRFFAYSFLLHSFILIAIILTVPATKVKRTGGEFFTRLVSPEEVLKYKPVVPVLPKKRVLPDTKKIPVIREHEKRISDPEKDNIKESVKTEKGSSRISANPPSNQSESRRTAELPVNPKLMQRGQAKEPSLREKLFDKGVIGDIAKKEDIKQENENRKTFSFDVSEYKFLVYNRRLKERIESIWVYPPTAASRGIYGDLLIKFTIQKNGNLGEVELVRTSGHKELDDAAIKALKDGAPYWPLPDEWGMDSYTILGHFVYTIYGYYIR